MTEGRARWVLLAPVLFLAPCTAREPTQPPSLAPPPPVVLAHRVELPLDLTPSHPLPEGAPSAILVAPEGLPLDRAPVVVYLHGWGGCAAAVLGEGRTPCYPSGPEIEGWGLGALPDTTPAFALVVVQLAFLEDSSSAGRFAEPGFARSWESELRAAVREGSGVEPGPLLLAAHSGGYRTLQAMLADDAEGTTAAIFLDGLYGGADEVADWVASSDDRRAISVHTTHDGTTAQSRRLAARATSDLGEEAVAIDPSDPETAFGEQRVVVVETEVHHGAVPEAWLDRILGALLGEPPP